MPIPKPQKDEKQRDYLSRCMGDKTMNKEYPGRDERAGVCYNEYRRSKKK